MENKRVVLASRPSGWVTEANFRVESVPVPKPKDGEVLVRNLWLSLDPYMRGRMNDVKSYAAKQELDQVMVGQTVGEVVESRSDKYKKGDCVLTPFGWQQYGCSDGKGLNKIDASRVPMQAYLDVLGMPGVTAWVGLLDICQPKAGETVLVSAASGAVGSVVGQIAKIKGCRAVGIAGGERKCRYVLEELDFDACLDHRLPDLPERLKAACPNGIDVYFENVGGAVFDAVLPLLNDFARVPVCGQIAHYNATELPAGPDRVPLLMHKILTKRLTFRGFIVRDFASQYPEFLADMSGWLREGRVKYREDVTDGLENAPRELIGLLKGANFGKKLIRVSPDPTR